MQCDQARDLLGAYQDEELSREERRGVSLHLETCRACSAQLADNQRISRLVWRHGKTPAPAELAVRIGKALDRAEIETPLAPSKAAERIAPVRTPFGAIHARSFARRAAALAAVCLVSVLATWHVMDLANRTDGIAREVLNAHLRSLLQDSPVQVATSDQHTVRPWFAGRTDYAPPVKDLAADGFALVGGRLDYVADRRVSALVYKRRLHVINVFMWASPSTADAAPIVTTRNGYSLLAWSQNGATYWAVSDLNLEELRALQRLL
jgi:anti-sigma factor RsiW